MTVLLDAHVWIWWLLGAEQLPTKERMELDDLAARGALRLAAVSLWEAQMLSAKNRLALNRPFDSWIRDAAAPDVVQVLPLDVDVVIALDISGAQASSRNPRRHHPKESRHDALETVMTQVFSHPTRLGPAR